MNSLSSNRELAQSKLILLYVIDKIGLPVSNLQITKLILENNIMNYFFLQQFLDELCSAHFLVENTSNEKTLYSITDSGKQTLNYFAHLIPPGIKSRIDETINAIRKSVKNETLITADYIPERDNEYIVNCKVHEDNFSLIELKITVGTKSDARMICKNWNNHSHEIYPEIIDALIKDRSKKNNSP